MASGGHGLERRPSVSEVRLCFCVYLRFGRSFSRFLVPSSSLDTPWLDTNISSIPYLLMRWYMILLDKSRWSMLLYMSRESEVWELRSPQQRSIAFCPPNRYSLGIVRSARRGGESNSWAFVKWTTLAELVDAFFYCRTIRDEWSLFRGTNFSPSYCRILNLSRCDIFDSDVFWHSRQLINYCKCSKHVDLLIIGIAWRMLLQLVMIVLSPSTLG